MRPAQRTGTTHPARSADHCAKNPQQYLELNTSHHIIIPSSKNTPTITNPINSTVPSTHTHTFTSPTKVTRSLQKHRNRNRKAYTYPLLNSTNRRNDVPPELH